MRRFVDACEAHCSIGNVAGPAVAGEECSSAWELLGLYRVASVSALHLLPTVMGSCSKSFPVNQRSKERNGHVCWSCCIQENGIHVCLCSFSL